MPSADQTHMAVLGALSIMPMTGYAVREQIRSTLGSFWSESFGQIYPALAQLEKQGLIERLPSQTSRSAPFAPTAAGLARLRELLAEEPQPSRPRNGTLLRLFFGRQLGAEACRALLEQTRTQAEAQLQSLLVAREELAADALLRDDAPYIELTISAGEHSARAAIAWAEESLAALDALPATPTTATPTTATTTTRSTS
ncbi:MAG: PadR family transcriptional regulator [Microcella sp.]|uniref:PadR family transcriptional regulator n=1 Tax=Microcella sp. TaxID=1913979 RepID=UPI003315BD60